MFLDLRAKIEQEFAPDYLLIDSRTGITETGGVATTVLPDTLVCCLANNRENLEGARGYCEAPSPPREWTAGPKFECIRCSREFRGRKTKLSSSACLTA